MAADAKSVVLPGDFSTQLAAKWEEFKGVENVTRGEWFKDVCKHFLKDEASKVALARTYAFKCRQSEASAPDGLDRELALALCKKIAEFLSLPNIKAKRALETTELAPE